MNVKEQYWKYSLVTIIVVLGTILFVEFIPFLGGILGACTIYILVRKQMLYLTEKKHLRRSFVAVILLLETILCFLIPLSLAVLSTNCKISIWTRPNWSSRRNILRT